MISMPMDSSFQLEPMYTSPSLRARQGGGRGQRRAPAGWSAGAGGACGGGRPYLQGQQLGGGAP